MAALEVETTPIPGLLVVRLPVHGDNRGWFKENWQRAKMTQLGLPDFGPVQNNISFNDAIGTTRGIHAEPWDKYVSVATGRIFGAWVDLRQGNSFGAVFSIELDPSVAVFVPRGVGNSYQTLDANTAYTYLVNDHWSASASYTFLNLADETAAIAWPIPLEGAELSEKDRAHPRLAEVVPMPPRRPVILGADGQLGLELRRRLPDALALSRADFDLTDAAAYDTFPWNEHGLVINAAAYTAVDVAETPAGRAAAWAVNVTALSHLARAAREHGFTLVHVSSDYVFDGTVAEHTEDEPFTPLGVYGQTKAAGDAIVASVERHYILRASWVIGEGANFVRTMASLATRGIDPSVVDDQIGRLTFTTDLVSALLHLTSTGAPFGTYNVSNSGEPQSWAQIARDVYSLSGHDPARVTGVTTAAYFEGKDAAPRPLQSTLSLAKLEATGFTPRLAVDALREYLA